MNRDMEWLMEQIDAAKDIVHLHRCVSCQMATAQTPVVIMEDVDGGLHVVIVGICDTCAETDEYDVITYNANKEGITV